MGPDYKLTIHGAQPGQDVNQVAQTLSPLLRHSAEQLLPALTSRQAITLTLRGLPLQGARGFKENIENAGCVCTLDSTGLAPQAGAVLAGDFSNLELRPFVSRLTGVTLNAPAHWRDESGKYFTIRHAGTQTWFNGSRTSKTDVTLPVWAEIRFSAVPEFTPHLKTFREPYSLETAAGPAIAAEFRGLVPGDTGLTHQLILVLRPEAGTLSLNITSTVEEFEKHQALYQWLLRTQLRLSEIGGTEPLVPAKMHPEAIYDVALHCAGSGRMKEAVEWFQRAVDMGHANAHYDLGHCYISGQGVEQNMRAAFFMWLKAAEKGVAPAAYNISAMYANGDGTAADPAQSFRWLKEAAELGDRNAQHSMGLRYYQGNGVPQDVEMSMQLFLKSADQGHAASQYYAGCMLECGDGAPKDVERAISLLRKAEAQGVKEATKKLREIGVQ
jgi:hypothetical protein